MSGAQRNLLAKVAKSLKSCDKEVLLAWKEMVPHRITEDILRFRKLHFQSFTTRIAGGDFQGWDKYLTALFMKLRTAHDFLKLGDSLHFCTCPVCLKHVMSKFSKKGEWIRVTQALESFVIYNMRLLLKEGNMTEAMVPLDQSNLTNLTLREKEVLQFILDGWTNKETAGQMGLSVKTVEAHRANIMRKLGIHNVAGLARYMCSMTHGLWDKKAQM